MKRVKKPAAPSSTFDLEFPETLVLDLINFKPKEVIAIKELIDLDIVAGPELGPLPVTTGWNKITPSMALDLLRRNRPGANREVDPATVNYYALQMAQNEWKKTGQPVLIDNSGKLVDAQHRLYAVVISGVTIETFVVVDVEAIPQLFAYIDNAKPRNAASALQTAGFNGVSGVIAKVIKLAEEVRLGVFRPGGIARLPRLTPKQMLDLTASYPNAREAARASASDWSNLVTFIGNRRKDVIAYLGMQIIDLHDSETADEFFDEVMDPVERDDGDPIGSLRKLIEKDLKNPKPMKRQNMLAALIKAFNAWKRDDTLKARWMYNPVNDPFPVLDGPEDQQEAA